MVFSGCKKTPSDVETSGNKESGIDREVMNIFLKHISETSVAFDWSAQNQ